MRCSITTNDSSFDAAAERLGINTLVFESERRLAYGDEVTVRVGFVEVKATVRWQTERGFGVQVGSLSPRDVWGLHRLGVR